MLMVGFFLSSGIVGGFYFLLFIYLNFLMVLQYLEIF